MAGTIFDELFGPGESVMSGSDSSNVGDTVAVDVPAALAVELKREARLAHKSASELVARIVADYLEDLADARVVARRRGGKTVPAGTVFARNGLEG